MTNQTQTPQGTGQKIDWDLMSQKQAEWMDYWSQNIKGKGGK